MAFGLFRAAEKLKDFIYGKNYTCYLCGNEVFGGEYFCADCKKLLPYNTVYCERCGRKVIQNGYCPDCKAHMPAFDKARSLFVYEGVARDAVLRFKSGAQWFAKAFIAEGMPVFNGEFADCDLISFTPMSEEGKRRRGYNQAELLARELGKHTGKKAEGVFEKVKETAEQKTLTKAERQKNLQGAFRLKKRAEVKGKVVLLLDDALTTGATAEALCKLLSGAGAKKIYLFTVSSVFYRADGVSPQA